MTIDKFDNIWANSGTTDEPSSAKKDQGFVGNDQPAMERFNWLHNMIQDKVRRLIVERMDSFYEEATDPQAMITTGLWSRTILLSRRFSTPTLM